MLGINLGTFPLAADSMASWVWLETISHLPPTSPHFQAQVEYGQTLQLPDKDYV